MTSNDLSMADVLDQGNELSFPDSVKALMRGDLGQTPGGFPLEIQQMVLKGEQPYTDKPNAHLDAVDFNKEFAAFQSLFSKHCSFQDFLCYKFYPKVFEDHHDFFLNYGDVWYIPTKAFFYGLENNQEVIMEIGHGKSIIVKLLYITDPNEDGVRQVFFKLNGQTRTIDVKDKSFISDKVAHRKAETDFEIGSPLQGKLSKVAVMEGDKVEKNDPLFIIEAMKMESTITAPMAGVIKKIYINGGEMIEQDDLVVELES
jgi:pyruvate carboxylase